MISVIMPVYNAEPYLGQSIGSILNQTHESFEFIIINDGSSDGSANIIERFAQQDERIRAYSRANKGVVFTRNEGIERSRGEFIAMMDADDISAPDRLALQSAYLISHPECVAVGARILLIDSDGLPLMKAINVFSHREIEKALLDGIGLAIAQGASMIRKEALASVGPYNTSFRSAEDMDLWLRLVEIGKLKNLRDVLIHYRQHLGSEGYKNRQTQLHWHKVALLDAYNRRNISIPEWLDSMDSDTAIKNTSISDIHRKWAWWALRGKNVPSARKHARLAIRHDPLSLENWRAFACAIRGY